MGKAAGFSRYGIPDDWPAAFILYLACIMVFAFAAGLLVNLRV